MNEVQACLNSYLDYLHVFEGAVYLHAQYPDKMETRMKIVEMLDKITEMSNQLKELML